MSCSIVILIIICIIYIYYFWGKLFKKNLGDVFIDLQMKNTTKQFILEEDEICLCFLVSLTKSYKDINQHFS